MLYLISAIDGEFLRSGWDSCILSAQQPETAQEKDEKLSGVLHLQVNMEEAAAGEGALASIMTGGAEPVDPYYCLHKNIERRRNRLGFGLYAKSSIPAGAIIYTPANSTTIARVDSRGMENWSEKQINFFEKYAWQVGNYPAFFTC